MVLFAYDFPHRKTQDFILRCVFYNIKIDLILAEGYKDLGIPQSSLRTKIRSSGHIDTKDLAERFNIPILYADHNSDVSFNALSGTKPKLGLISGARIIKKRIIDCFSCGIINFHPGLLPDVRGLDSMLWAINMEKDQGVSSHLIDSKVDAGKVIEIKKIPILSGDTIFDVSERLYETQLNMLESTIAKAESNDFINVNFNGSTAYSKMPIEIEEKLDIERYIKQRSI